MKIQVTLGYHNPIAGYNNPNNVEGILQVGLSAFRNVLDQNVANKEVIGQIGQVMHDKLRGIHFGSTDLEIRQILRDVAVATNGNVSFRDGLMGMLVVEVCEITLELKFERNCWREGENLGFVAHIGVECDDHQRVQNTHWTITEGKDESVPWPVYRTILYPSGEYQHTDRDGLYRYFQAVSDAKLGRHQREVVVLA